MHKFLLTIFLGLSFSLNCSPLEIANSWKERSEEEFIAGTLIGGGFMFFSGLALGLLPTSTKLYSWQACGVGLGLAIFIGGWIKSHYSLTNYTLHMNQLPNNSPETTVN